MKVLATDLDRTLLPNGHWPADDGAIELFNRLTETHDVMVVYVTGRNLSLTEGAIEEYGIRYPHALIGDVGTTIRRYDADAWHADPGWEEHVLRECPRWDIAAIQQALAAIDGVTEQAAEHNNPFKQSYYLDHGNRDAILASVREAIEGNFDEVIIYSYDSKDDKGLLDVLPTAATKQTALEYLVHHEQVDKEHVVFCGDSGNDIPPLTAGFNGVLVRNADDQLVADVKKAQEENPALKAYFAQGGFNGLSGYYTSGVIEGAFHYGLFEHL